MDSNNHLYDCAIIGGGLAGLALSIELARGGKEVILFEKNSYPFHRVCGEYISMESWDYIQRLGVPLTEMELPRITNLSVSSEKGFKLHHRLEPGGFGISRYTLDETLCQVAMGEGVVLKSGCAVRNVRQEGITWSIDTTQGSFLARVVCGSFGKYAPAFFAEAENKGSKLTTMNYIGVKYHIKTDLPADRIELHNFEGGYCGVSKVDQDRYCLCYLTNSANLLHHQKNIKAMEEEVLYKNPFLKEYFTASDFLFEKPVVVSNVEFRKKHSSVDGVFLLGDAAGSITPLCGNGMSMALRGASILSKCLMDHFNANRPMNETIAKYHNDWDAAFDRRITAGYYLQYLFGKGNMTDLALKLLSLTPGLTRRVIGLTHGDPF